MNYYILFYKTVADYIERRGEFRSEHLKLAREAAKKGDLILGGALDEPANEAVLVFKGTSPEIAENFAKNDPYVKNRLISHWVVRPWNIVVKSEEFEAKKD